MMKNITYFGKVNEGKTLSLELEHENVFTFKQQSSCTRNFGNKATIKSFIE